MGWFKNSNGAEIFLILGWYENSNRKNCWGRKRGLKMTLGGKGAERYIRLLLLCYWAWKFSMLFVLKVWYFAGRSLLWNLEINFIFLPTIKLTKYFEYKSRFVSYNRIKYIVYHNGSNCSDRLIDFKDILHPGTKAEIMKFFILSTSSTLLLEKLLL